MKIHTVLVVCKDVFWLSKIVPIDSLVQVLRVTTVADNSYHTVMVIDGTKIVIGYSAVVENTVGLLKYSTISGLIHFW